MEGADRRYADPIDARLPDMAKGLPLTLIGYWEYGPVGDVVGFWEYVPADDLQRLRARRARSDYEPKWPMVTDFVDERWDETERDRVASYLDDGYCPWADAGWSTCRFCGGGDGSCELTDGAYLWPEGLAHYVREHGVRLPVSVIRHIVGGQARDERWPGVHQDAAEYEPAPTDDAIGIPVFLRVGGQFCVGDCDEDWWKALTGEDQDHKPGDREWSSRRVNYDWWKTATLDS